jgi:hypothetical protein
VAHDRILEAVGRRTALARARDVLNRLSGTVDGEAEQYLGMARNLSEVWPNSRGFGAGRAPWPAEPGPALVWQCQHLDLWLPSPSQLAIAWDERVAARRATPSGIYRSQVVR